MRFPLLTERLLLRPLVEDDLDDLAAVYTHPEVARWIGPHTHADVAEELRRQIGHQAEHGWSLWAVRERESGRLVGDCGLQPLEHRGPEVELGYDLHPDVWGRGLATEAARAVVAAAFGPLGLDRIVAVVRPDHVASQRVLEKAGLARVEERTAYGIPMLLYEARAGHRATLVSEFTHQAEAFNASPVANAAATLDDLVRLAAPRPGERWLEAACGPGLISRRLAALTGSVVGVDATPAMIEVARREAGALANAEFALGDATALEHPDGSFDGAIARFAIHHIPVPARLVEELARVVRPGGAVVLADHVADEDADAAAWSQEIERLRDPSHWACLPVARLRALGERAGLTLEQEHVFPYEHDFAEWLHRGSGAGASARLIERALAERPPSAECFAVQDGVLRLRMWTARWRR